MKNPIKLNHYPFFYLVLLSFVPAIVTLIVITMLGRSPSVLASMSVAETGPSGIPIIASAGIIDESSIDIIALKGPTAQLKPDAPTPSTAVLRYNIGLPNLTPAMYHYTWTVRFRDTGAADRVLIQLRQLNIKTGALTTVSTFNSDDYPPATGYQTRTFSYERQLNNDMVLYKEARLMRLAAGGKPGLEALKFEYDTP